MGTEKQRFLSDIGIGPHQPSLAQMMEERPRRTIVAYCNSITCTRGKSKRVQKPYVKKNSTFCPSCRSALIWDYESK